MYLCVVWVRVCCVCSVGGCKDVGVVLFICSLYPSQDVFMKYFYLGMCLEGGGREGEKEGRGGGGREGGGGGREGGGGGGERVDLIHDHIRGSVQLPLLSSNAQEMTGIFQRSLSVDKNVSSGPLRSMQRIEPAISIDVAGRIFKLVLYHYFNSDVYKLQQADF